MINFYAMHIKKCIISGVLTCLFVTLSFSQTQIETKSEFWQNVQFGGGVGLNFGDGFFSGSLTPNAVYKLSPYISAGAGLNFSYSSQRDTFKSTVLGASVIGLFNPYEALQVSTEFEQLHVSRNFDEQFIANADDQYWYPALFLGLGYRTGNVTFGVRYDVLYNENKSVYASPFSPIVRFYF